MKFNSVYVSVRCQCVFDFSPASSVVMKEAGLVPHPAEVHASR